jgi:hypothetical protein
MFSIKRNEKGFWTVDEFEFHNIHSTELIYAELQVVINHWLAEKQNVDVSEVIDECNCWMQNI